jgi:hypothetical protein
MTAPQFFAKYINLFVDFDHVYGPQCVDLFEFYNKECIGGTPVYGNAVDIWTRYPKNLYDQITNTPENCPVEGDIIIWGTTIGAYGHIAVCRDAGLNAFNSFDQNWPLNSPCHFQAHNYHGVLGWLRPKVTPSPDIPTPPPPPAPTQVETPPVVVEPPVIAPEPPTAPPVPETPITTTYPPDVVITTNPVISKPTIFQLIVAWLKSLLAKWKK